jgi:hypothetical protein
MSGEASNQGTADTIDGENTFTWIDFDDQDATRRIKTVAIRNYRGKQKAEAAKFQRRKEIAVRRTLLSATTSKETKTDASVVKERPRPLPVVANIVEQVPTLGRQIGNNIDPFNLFPAQLNSQREGSLVHHCKP